MTKVRDKIIHRRKRKATTQLKIWNSDKLRNEEIRKEYSKLVEIRLQDVNCQKETDMNILWNSLRNGVYESVKEILAIHCQEKTAIH